MKMQKHVICKETFEEKYIKDKKYKVEIPVIKQVNVEVLYIIDVI